MKNNIFREKSLERISSPEQLDRYIKIANPGMWIVLSAIIVLLASMCVWGIFGRLETVVNASGMVENGIMSTTLNSENSHKVEPGMEVYLDDKAVGRVERLSYSPNGEVEAEISTANLADGKYNLEIITDSIKPMEFIFN
ncbi:MAG: hypothetical protein E7508_03835 [Ruminococcus sp.]|nr:hypothetical protein [Ruminococcus sp.]